MPPLPPVPIPSRRLFLAAAVAGGVRWLGSAGAGRRLEAQSPEGQADDAGRLYNPGAVQQRTPTTDLDNDAYIKEIEKGLRCTCGCNLDIYTCRTTDFSCQTSPALHREILALHRDGKSADEIREDFIARYGEEVLMAPKAEGFNLAGYLVPGSVVLVAGTLLTLHLLRKRSLAVAAASAATGASRSDAPAPAPRRESGVVSDAVDASPEELARLRELLEEEA